MSMLFYFHLFMKETQLQLMIIMSSIYICGETMTIEYYYLDIVLFLPVNIDIVFYFCCRMCPRWELMIFISMLRIIMSIFMIILSLTVEDYNVDVILFSFIYPHRRHDDS